MSLIMLICVYAVSVLGLVLIPGIDNEGNPWQMGFFHAFYFVSFMGSTIGFGEIPYPFTDAQRMWTIFSIYSTVIAWLFAIGNLLKIIQDPIFKKVFSTGYFDRDVARISEPFYIICGYGDTGSLLARGLNRQGIQTTVIDIDQIRIDELELEDYSMYIPGLCANAAEPDNLIKAGMLRPNCIGVIALTNVDHTNLTIAIACKLLNPQLKVICRSETHDAADNMASFGTDHIVNPFDIFANRLITAIDSPSMHLLYDWFTSGYYKPVSELLTPPRGKWILCGYGRMGKEIHRNLINEDIDTIVIEATPDITGLPQGGITGRGTEAHTLQEANVEESSAIIAGTDDDANNLSIIMTAKELNPDLFTVARQNERCNNAIFEAADADVIMQKSSIVSRHILARLTNPLLSDFLRLTRHQDNTWSNVLISRISGLIGDHTPDTWVIEIGMKSTPAIYTLLKEGRSLYIEDIYKDPRESTVKLDCFPLLVKRDMDETLLPEDKTTIHINDKILFTGTAKAQSLMRWSSHDYNSLYYVHTGRERARGYVWRKMQQRFSRQGNA